MQLSEMIIMCACETTGTQENGVPHQQRPPRLHPPDRFTRGPVLWLLFQFFLRLVFFPNRQNNTVITIIKYSVKKKTLIKYVLYFLKC